MRASYPEQKPNVEDLVSSNSNWLKNSLAYLWTGSRFCRNRGFDPDRLLWTCACRTKLYCPEGASFSSYASIRVRGSIIDHLRKSSNLCRTTIQMQQKAKVAEDNLRQVLGRDPNSKEIAEKLEFQTRK